MYYYKPPLKVYLRKHPTPSLAGQAPSQPVPRADELLFSPISQPGKHFNLDAMTREPLLRL
jgi:hypothetical protein